MDPETVMKIMTQLENEELQSTQAMLDAFAAKTETKYVSNGERAGEFADEVATKVTDKVIPIMKTIAQLDPNKDAALIEILKDQIKRMAEVSTEANRLQKITNDRLAKLPHARQRRR